MPITIRTGDVLDDDARELLSRADAALGRSGTDPLGRRAGAAVRCADGSVHAGAMFAAPDEPVVICAEVAAIAAAHSAGGLPVSIAVVANGTEPPSPCGSCRSVLAAVGRAGGQELIVYLTGGAGNRVVLTTSGELLP